MSEEKRRDANETNQQSVPCRAENCGSEKRLAIETKYGAVSQLKQGDQFIHNYF
jgi:hypothetical protein